MPLSGFCQWSSKLTNLAVPAVQKALNWLKALDIIVGSSKFHLEGPEAPEVLQNQTFPLRLYSLHCNFLFICKLNISFVNCTLPCSPGRPIGPWKGKIKFMHTKFRSPIVKPTFSPWGPGSPIFYIVSVQKGNPIFWYICYGQNWSAGKTDHARAKLIMPA